MDVFDHNSKHFAEEFFQVFYYNIEKSITHTVWHHKAYDNKLLQKNLSINNFKKERFL